MAPSETSPKKPRLRRQSRRSNGACPNLLLRVHQLAQPLTDLEERYPLLGYADGVARLGVPALAGVPMPDTEAPEPAQLDLVPLAQSLGDVVEDGVDDQLGFLLREACQLGHFFDQFRLGHEPTPSKGGPCRSRVPHGTRRPATRSYPPARYHGR